jgi:DNA polymerase III epsilon subunit-like protein
MLPLSTKIMQTTNFTTWFKNNALQQLNQSINYLNQLMDEQIQIYKRDCKPNTNVIPPEYLQFQAEKCLETFKINLMTQLKQACFNQKFIIYNKNPIDKPIKLNNKNTLMQLARLSASASNFQTLPQLAFIDIETDGININDANILQIAIIKPILDPEYDSLDYTVAWSSYITPSCRYTQKDNKAYHINHIGDEQLKSAMNIVDAISLISHHLEDTILVGYNINSFDIPIIKRHLSDFNLPLLHKFSIDLYPACWKDKKQKLEDAIQSYNLFNNPNPHDAMADAYCCVDLLNELLEKQELPNTEDDLLDLFNSPQNTWPKFKGYKIVEINPDHNGYSHHLLPTPVSSLKRKHSQINIK